MHIFKRNLDCFHEKLQQCNEHNQVKNKFLSFKNKWTGGMFSKVKSWICLYLKE